MNAARPGAAVARTADQISPGDAVVIRGVGTVPVRDVWPMPSGELLIVTGWDRLAVISSPASEWEVRPSPMPGAAAVWVRRDRVCRGCRGREYV